NVAGTDLLNLISDILDLSKIESGTVTVDAEELFFSNLLDMLGRPFRHEADNRQLSFDVQVDPHLGHSIVTDAKRLQQVLKNLLSNAFKFTERGGEIHLRSSPGVGSTFTLYLPIKYVGPTSAIRLAQGPSPSALRPVGVYPAGLPERPTEAIPDDRLAIEPGDTTLLIVEDDPHYARVMVDLARDKGFKVLVAMRGADALDLARQYQPTAVSLDVFLPDMLGWTVLSQLKQNPATRHIPVQIITLDEDRQHGLARGAFSFVNKPTTAQGLKDALARIRDYAKPPRKRLRLAGDAPAEQMSIRELLSYDDIEID